MLHSKHADLDLSLQTFMMKLETVPGCLIFSCSSHFQDRRSLGDCVVPSCILESQPGVRLALITWVTFYRFYESGLTDHKLTLYTPSVYFSVLYCIRHISCPLLMHLTVQSPTCSRTWWHRLPVLVTSPTSSPLSTSIVSSTMR